MAPARVAEQERLGVACSPPNGVAEFLTERAVIVNFAIHHDDVAGRGIGHGLFAGRRKIEDREPPVA